MTKLGPHDHLWAARSSHKVRKTHFVFVPRERKVAQLTQMQLAVKAGIDQADLSRLETGQGVRGATIGFVERVAHALGREVVIRFVDPASKADSAGVTLSR
jgi:transcriptional regulator with XRE-family HTH domain